MKGPGINLVVMKLIRPNVKNEWGTLKEIIVGSALNAQVPTIGDKCLHNVDYAHLSNEEFQQRPSGLYPQQLIEETEEDLDKSIQEIKECVSVADQLNFKDSG